MDPFGMIALLIPYAGMATGVVMMYGVYRLLNRWMDRKDVPNPEMVDEVRRLREEVESLHGVADRVLELEERVDFTERVMSRERRDELPSGG